MNYEEITKGYPSLEFLQALLFQLKHELFQERTPTTRRFKGAGTHFAKLKPFLDQWYYPREYWYAKDCIHGLEQLVNAKVFVNRKLAESDEGLLFLGSTVLRTCEEQLEETIVSSLALKGFVEGASPRG